MTWATCNWSPYLFHSQEYNNTMTSTIILQIPTILLQKIYSCTTGSTDYKSIHSTIKYYVPTGKYRFRGNVTWFADGDSESVFCFQSYYRHESQLSDPTSSCLARILAWCICFRGAIPLILAVCSIVHFRLQSMDTLKEGDPWQMWEFIPIL